MSEDKDQDQTAHEELTFEEAIAELEEIVKSLEDGKMALDQSLKRYERGTILLNFCDKKLKDSASKIEILRKTGDNQAEWQDYQS